MGHVRESVLIEAPLERVWAFGMQLERIPEWNTTAVAVKDVSRPVDRAGARHTVVAKIAGRPLDVTWEITSIEPMRFVESVATTPGGGGARQRVEWEREGSGTRVSIDIEFEIAPGVLGGIVDKLFAERAVERDVRHSAENLKAIIESEAPVGAR